MGQAASDGSVEKKRPGGGRWIGPAVLAVALVAILVIAIPNIMASRATPGEAPQLGYMKAYVGAQSIFVKNANYPARPGEFVYANPYTDLFEIGYRGEPKDEVSALRLISRDLADAHYDLPDRKARSGYFFRDITADADGPYDPAEEFGLCAVPASYGGWFRSIYICDVTGSVYRKDAAAVYPHLRKGEPVRPVTVYPSDPVKEGWTRVGG